MRMGSEGFESHPLRSMSLLHNGLRGIPDPALTFALICAAGVMEVAAHLGATWHQCPRFMWSRSSALA